MTKYPHVSHSFIRLSFPNSVIEYFQGYLGIPPFGFPEPLRSRVLKDRTIQGANGLSCFDGRPGAQLPPYDFEGTRKRLEEKWGEEKLSEYDVMSCAYSVTPNSLIFLISQLISLPFHWNSQMPCTPQSSKSSWRSRGNTGSLAIWTRAPSSLV